MRHQLILLATLLFLRNPFLCLALTVPRTIPVLIQCEVMFELGLFLFELDHSLLISIDAADHTCLPQEHAMGIDHVCMWHKLVKIVVGAVELLSWPKTLPGQHDRRVGRRCWPFMVAASCN